ncbi:hypothetical protein GOODEAATRI_024610 [Goodea atripinnis]|uniref:Uncharacterized protein n=1 Tax=Goodea atripinnis TaxID=208336 RepID=A0ABV0Q160_9TELE
MLLGFQRLSVQEVPPLLNGDSSRSQQQRSLPSSSSSHSDSGPPQGSPHTFRSASSTGGAAGGSSCGASPQHASMPLSTSASPLPEGSPATSNSTMSSTSTQQGSLLLATNTSNLSPSLIPSTVMSLSQISQNSSPSQGMTLPILHSAPHSPPLSHSAPLSRAMTPVQLLHQQVGQGGSHTLSPSHNPWLLKAGDVSATATLPLPRRPVSEMRVGGFQGSSLPRVLPLLGVTHVEALFAHTPGVSEGPGGNLGGGACLLHFLPGDNITLLISEPRDGWHYGQNERTGRYDAIPALTPESEEERSLPPQRVSTFRPRPYSMADSNKVRHFKLVEGGQLMCPHSVMFCCDLRCRQLITLLWFADYIRFSWFPTITHQVESWKLHIVFTSCD